MDSGQLILSLRARPENLVHLRSLIVDFLAALGVQGEAANDAKLGVSEVATNALIHGYGGCPGEIDVEARSDGNRLVIALSDKGSGARAAPRTDPETGRGIPLVRAIAEDVAVSRDDDGTRVELTFAVP